MDAVEQCNDDPRLGQANSEDRSAEFERYGSLLFGIVPNDQLERDGLSDVLLKASAENKLTLF